MPVEPDKNIAPSPLESLDYSAVRRAYEHIREDVLAVKMKPLDRLRITGADRIDLLERLSTNTYKGISAGQHVSTALLEATGRLIDLLDVFVLPDQLIVSVSPGSGERVARWLSDHIFFQDDVNIGTVDRWPGAVALFGPNCDHKLKDLFGRLPAIAKQHYHFEDGVFIVPIQWSDSPGYQLYFEHSQHLPGLKDGASPSTHEVSLHAVEAHRIEGGIPGRGNEIKPGVIPLDAGMQSAISFSKGCYIGQEVIARLESRNTSAARLMGIRLSAPAPAGEKLVQAGREIGTLTSSAYSPLNDWIGLGIVKLRLWDSTGHELSVQNAHFTFQELPFPNT
jgi:aminomethyltransferase